MQAELLLSPKGATAAAGTSLNMASEQQATAMASKFEDRIRSLQRQAADLEALLKVGGGALPLPTCPLEHR